MIRRGVDDVVNEGGSGCVRVSWGDRDDVGMSICGGKLYLGDDRCRVSDEFVYDRWLVRNRGSVDELMWM